MAKKKLGSTKLTDELFVGSISLTTDVTGVLPPANGGTGITSLGADVATALGVNVGTAGSFVVNGGVLGTPSSGTLTNVSGLPINAGTTGTLPVSRGGTGITAGTSGGVPYFSGTGTIASSGVLQLDSVVIGGGAGASPSVVTQPVTGFAVLMAPGTLAGGAPYFGYISDSSFDPAYAKLWGIWAWQIPSAESSNTIEVTGFQTAGANGGGANADANTIIKVVVSDSASDCSPSATATIAAAGTPVGSLLDGSGTATAIFRTSGSGTVRIAVTETAAATRYLWVETGIGSRFWTRMSSQLSLTFA